MATGQGGRELRRTPRYRVNLVVRFASAVDFVTEYADNLSSNGLFIRSSGSDLKVFEEVGVELGLPGLGAFKVGVRIAHVLTVAQAAANGAAPGAGCEIIERPPGFDDALQEYLRRLGRRREHTVLCHDDEPLAFFGQMGYQVGPVPVPNALVEAIGRCAVPVVAVVVPPDGDRLFRRALAPAGAEDLLRVAATYEELDALLTDLDRQL
jgi:hypothetical protein